jgi:hypothetical protein
MNKLVMVGGPAHGKRCVLIRSVFYGELDKTYTDYVIETINTRDPQNRVSRHVLAVHRDLLLHRKCPDRASIMYLANEDALHAYIFDALLRVVGHE